MPKPPPESEPYLTQSRLVAFLYELMRDHVPPGVIEKIVSTDEAKYEDGTSVLLTNRHLGAYADEVAVRLLSR